jgi:hypothetical protein|nr:MAG TPA: hypothetical protein [Crassvirales sp.]
MSLSNGKITAPVSIDDVKNCFGLSSNDLGTLIKNANINVWAKYKPTVYPSPFPDDWYRGGDGNYGLNITVDNKVSTVSNLVAQYSKTNNGYSNLYKRPTGGSSAPYRMGDFRGYNHVANPELSDYLAVTQLTRESAHQLAVAYNVITTDGDQVSYTQISAYSGFRFGFIIMNGSNLATILTAVNTINNGDYKVTLPANRLQLGIYQVYPMFCSADYSSSDTLKQMNLYAVPNLTGGKTLQIISQSNVVMNYFESINAKQVGSRISVKLKTKSNAPALTATVYCVYSTTDPSKGQSLSTGESYENLTLAAGGATASTFFSIDASKSYHIYVLCRQQWIIKGLMPLQDIIDF